MPSYDTIWVFKDLPLEAAPLQLGPVDVKHMMFWEVDAKTKDIMRDKYGPEFDERWFHEGFVGSVVRAEAQDPPEAVRRLFPLMDTVADALALRLDETRADIGFGLDRAPRVLPTVAVREAGSAGVLFYQYHRELLMTVKADDYITRFNRRVFAHLLVKLPRDIFPGSATGSQTEAATRLRRSIHWWAEARVARPLASKFMLAWTALESLVTWSQEPRAGKGDRIKARLRTLVEKHTRQSSPPPHLDKLWDLRCEVIHEAATGYFDSAAQHSQNIAAHLDQLSYLFVLALLHVLDTWGAFPSLSDIWANLPSYAPSLRVEPDDLPSRHLTLDFLAGPLVSDPANGSSE